MPCLNNSPFRSELDRPIYASVTRLTAQKGVELIRHGANDILAAGGFFIALGSGEKDSEQFLQALRRSRLRGWASTSVIMKAWRI